MKVKDSLRYGSLFDFFSILCCKLNDLYIHTNLYSYPSYPHDVLSTARDLNLTLPSGDTYFNQIIMQFDAVSEDVYIIKGNNENILKEPIVHDQLLQTFKGYIKNAGEGINPGWTHYF
jgi:hypothetical protein